MSFTTEGRTRGRERENERVTTFGRRYNTRLDPSVGVPFFPWELGCRVPSTWKDH